MSEYPSRHCFWSLLDHDILIYSKTPIYRGFWGRQKPAVNRGFGFWGLKLAKKGGKNSGARFYFGFAIYRGAVNRGFTV